MKTSHSLLRNYCNVTDQW